MRALTAPNVQAISLRDGVLALGRSAKAKVPVLARPDPGLLARYFINPSGEARDAIGLGVIDRGDEFTERLFLLYAGLVAHFDSTGRPWQFFCNGSFADAAVAEQFAHRLGGRSGLVAARPRSPQELVNLVTSYRSIISCRLRSLIVAASFRVPAVGILWDSKIGEFLASIERSASCASVNDHADVVLAKFLQSEAEGYDEDLLESLALCSWNGLVEDVTAALKVDAKGSPLQPLPKSGRRPPMPRR